MKKELLRELIDYEKYSKIKNHNKYVESIYNYFLKEKIEKSFFGYIYFIFDNYENIILSSPGIEGNLNYLISLIFKSNNLDNFIEKLKIDNYLKNLLFTLFKECSKNTIKKEFAKKIFKLLIKKDKNFVIRNKYDFNKDFLLFIFKENIFELYKLSFYLGEENYFISKKIKFVFENIKNNEIINFLNNQNDYKFSNWFLEEISNFINIKNDILNFLNKDILYYFLSNNITFYNKNIIDKDFLDFIINNNIKKNNLLSKLENIEINIFDSEKFTIFILEEFIRDSTDIYSLKVFFEKFKIPDLLLVKIFNLIINNQGDINVNKIAKLLSLNIYKNNNYYFSLKIFNNKEWIKLFINDEYSSYSLLDINFLIKSFQSNIFMKNKYKSRNGLKNILNILNETNRKKLIKNLNKTLYMKNIYFNVVKKYQPKNKYELQLFDINKEYSFISNIFFRLLYNLYLIIIKK